MGGDQGKILYNLAFQEMRKYVEDAFQRLYMWFPIIGNNKDYWNYNLDILILVVHATTKLHNFILSIKNKNYTPNQFDYNIFRKYW